MSIPVDLTNLRTMTDGDRDLESALFQEFYTSTEAGLQSLAGNCTDGQNEVWRATAHALKGTSYNLGANAMGDLCKKAQETPAASGLDKRTLLGLLQAEYIKVKAFLETVHT
jgi:HPt (histidine-containing phosphotransfer) domain-containing protein